MLYSVLYTTCAPQLHSFILTTYLIQATDAFDKWNQPEPTYGLVKDMLAMQGLQSRVYVLIELGTQAFDGVL